jgi:hypothetical protein
MRPSQIKKQGIEAINDHCSTSKQQYEEERETGPALHPLTPIRCQLDHTNQDTSKHAKHACFKR